MRELIIELGKDLGGNVDRQRMYVNKESISIRYEFVRPDGSVTVWQDEGADIAIQDIDEVIEFLQEVKKEAQNA